MVVTVFQNQESMFWNVLLTIEPGVSTPLPAVFPGGEGLPEGQAEQERTDLPRRDRQRDEQCEASRMCLWEVEHITRYIKVSYRDGLSTTGISTAGISEKVIDLWRPAVVKHRCMAAAQINA